jgi:hypothetical protein
MLRKKSDLAMVSGKFIFFSNIRRLVVADSLALYHKDIFLSAQSWSFRVGAEIPTWPDGYGRLDAGVVVSWESVFFGVTTEHIRAYVLAVLAELEDDLVLNPGSVLTG